MRGKQIRVWHRLTENEYNNYLNMTYSLNIVILQTISDAKLG